MSNSFDRNFEEFVNDVANDLNIAGSEEIPRSRFSKSSNSSAAILPGDVLFFKYRSSKFGDVGDHIGMVIGNSKNVNGVYSYTSTTGSQKGVAKVYLSAVKLNNIWHETASTIIEAYRDKQLKYSSVKDDGKKSEDPQKFDKEKGSEEEKEKNKGPEEDRKKVEESKDRKTKKSFMSLVGRGNYRSYIVNNMWSAYKFGDKAEDTE